MQAAYGHVDRAIEIAKVSGPESYVSHYLNTKAECAAKMGRLDEAHQFASEALAVAERTANPRAAAGARVVLADVARQRGLRDESISRLEEAAAGYRLLDARRELGDVLMRLSAVAKERGDSETAQRYAEQAYEATKATSGLMGR